MSTPDEPMDEQTHTIEGWLVTVERQMVDGRVEIVGLHLQPNPELDIRRAKVTSASLRKLRLKDLRRPAEPARYSKVDVGWLELPSHLEDGKLSRVFLSAVGAIYETGVESGTDPVALVCRLTGATRSAAQAWVRKARDANLLASAEDFGATGGRRPRAPK